MALLALTLAPWQEGTARVITALCACVTQSRESVDGNSSILVCACMVCGPRDEADRQRRGDCRVPLSSGHPGQTRVVGWAIRIIAAHSESCWITVYMCGEGSQTKKGGVELPRDASRGTLMALLL